MKGWVTISYIFITITALCIATIIDVWKWRIPNWLTVSSALIGLIHGAFMKGWGGLGEHLIAMAVGLFIFFLLYLLGGFGAGDAKLMGALGALMGLPFIVYASVMSIVAGGIISLFILLFRRGLKGIIYIYYSFMKSLFTGKGKEFQSNVASSNNAFPFSIAITIGSVITLWLMYPSF